jgi:hypothetical protein
MSLVLPSEIVVGLIIAVALLLLGDYFGHKFGRMKLAITGGITALVLVILFAIYAILFALLHLGS